MDLIYSNSVGVDIGVVSNYNLDMDVGLDDDFELKVPMNNHILRSNYLIYVEGTEYGGIIDTIKSDTSTSTISYSGRTWRGLLKSKIVEPNEGESHLIISGDINNIIKELLVRCDMSDVFFIGNSNINIDIKNKRFSRYVNLLSAIESLLDDVNLKLSITHNNGRLELTATRVKDVSELMEITDEVGINYTAERNFNGVNHLICLGSGELEDRDIINLYVNEKGEIVDNEFFSGLDKVSEVYDYPSVENIEELRSEGIKRLKDRMSKDTLNVNVEGVNIDIGDKIYTKDEITGIQKESIVSQKILSLENSDYKINYKVGG